MIAVDGPYQARPDRTWRETALRLAGGILLAPLLIAALVGAAAVSAALSLASPGRPGGGGRGLLGQLASQLSGTYIRRKLLRPIETESVRDVRLRDEEGLEHLVRIRGELVAGNVLPGDEIEVSGYDRSGTLIVREGWNYRTRARIAVRSR